MTSFLRTLAAGVGAFLLGAAALAATPTIDGPLPLDWRMRIEADEFVAAVDETSGPVWLSPRMSPPLPFDELIYDWVVRLPRDEGFRLYFQVIFADGDESPWLYGGYWGQVKDAGTSGGREIPRFADGSVEMDQLLLKRAARAFQFMVVSEGRERLTELPSIGVITTLNKPVEGSAARADEATTVARPSQASLMLNLPLRAQKDVRGQPLPDRCQSAALASAMEYFGTTVTMERIIAHTTDDEYLYPGIWPRTLCAGVEFGFDTYIDRFRDWEHVRETIAENKVILCSIKITRGHDCEAPPYPWLGGHIVALNGFTGDGRVIVTDSYLYDAGTGARSQWLMEDFEKVWMRNKGGVGMVICPPPGAVMKTVDAQTIPPFPDRSAIQAEMRAAAAAPTN